MKKIEKTIEFAGRKLTLSSGHVAQQATSAVMAKYGETVVLATVVAAPPKEDLGYFPLMVEYQERLYAGGKIKGSRWVKREGRPSDDEILTARLIDRSIRPLFPKEYKKEVQVVVTVLSVDLENSPDFVSAVAVSAALTASSIPWNGPVSVIKLGVKDKDFVINPLISEKDSSELDLIVSSTEKAIVMIEAGAKEVPEEKLLEAIGHVLKEGNKLIAFINDFAGEVGRKKENLESFKITKDFEKKVRDLVTRDLGGMVTKLAQKEAGNLELDEFKKAVAANFEESEKSSVFSLIDEIIKAEIRRIIFCGKRLDGRKPDELRKLSAEVSILPRTHGSGLFQRGQTQVLSIATLGAPSLGQLIESAEGEETKRYMHFYSMPPFSMGETGRMGYPSRREIGHGALAEKALLPVIPSESEFPYTISVVSEVLSSNGSTSMASTCGSTLALMDAGVPLKAPVVGIAMGLVIEKEKEVILTDIVGLEDENGDMDFKIAGTEKGVTALQLDVKTLYLSIDILQKAFAQAKKAREEILEVILKAIAAPRDGVSKFAPKIKVLKVAQDKIGEVIGPGGRVIRKIIAETGAQVEVEDDGSINISGLTQEAVEKAVAQIEALTKEVSPGEIYEGVVKRVESFGAFIEILPGKDGMVHVSDMSMDYVSDPSEVVKIGDKVKVRVKEVDNLGRINLSMLLDGDKPKRNGFDSQGGRERRRFDKRGSFDRNRNDRNQRRSSGPHFPTSRYLNPPEGKRGNY